ncbi:CotH kinase family protein [Hymenobacter sp. H14-R3]|uniref:CotH kinase family protein n=1 Tax=Hymenobacter sp. H14-R3 TaxID=3046308 RepID=UPI0024B878C6|nr:CotH kinase family protein [Hymenobacter sp. H14-R3]MDJ0364671.1 CotH kinase family protein [Hymenobacter sp. H14-R3]
MASATHAQGSLTIDPQFAHVDSAKHLVLINAPVHQLNAGHDTLRALRLRGQEFVLAQPVARVNTRQAYPATAGSTHYTLYFTQLPIIEINTHYQIVDEPGVRAVFSLVDTAGTAMQSAMGIEIRGGWSQSLPKKSYGFDLWADTLGTASQDLALLGMRTNSKWNLQAMYTDQLRLRSKVAYELWDEMNKLYYQAKEPDAKNGIALAYAELFLNGSYQGIYSLTERVDRKQLKLKKYNKGIQGELYKGINAADGASTFVSVPPIDNSSLIWGGFEYKEPSELTDWANLRSFVDLVVNGSDAEFYNQYQSLFRLDNAVDYFIFINLLRAADNTGKNAYIAKYKPNEPYFYVPWDLDGTFGNNWFGANDAETDDLLSNGFYDRLQKDYAPGGFRAALASRWAELRASVVTKEHIVAKFTQHNQYLLASNVYEREHLAWPDYQYDTAQLTYPANWLTGRIAYLDSVFIKPHAALGVADAALATQLQVYPNPASGYLSVTVGPAPCQLVIRDVSGKVMEQLALAGGVNKLDISSLPKGMYLVSALSKSATAVRKLVVQ